MTFRDHPQRITLGTFVTCETFDQGDETFDQGDDI